MKSLVQRLISARKAAGISQAIAAEHLNISRPTFIAIEKGTREVKPEELKALALLYNTSINRLMRQHAPPTQVAPHLRAVVEREGEDAGLEAAVAKLVEFVDDYMFLLDKVQGHTIPMPPPQPARTALPVERFAEDQASEQRRLLGFGDREPIGSLRKTLDEIGIHVFIDGLDSKLAGLYAYVENFGYCILVNRKHPQARRRWTIAHEFGHFLFDRDRRGVDYVEPMQRKPENERFADAFAMHFLMPAEGIKRRFHDTYQQKGDVSVGDVLRIADYYGVSLMAMVLRFESLGLVRRNSWNDIKASGAKVRDIRTEAGIEIQEDREPVEIFPDRYLMLAIEAWSAQKTTTSQFAKLTRKSIIEARDFALARSQQTEDNESAVKLSLGESLLHRGQPSA